MTVTDVRKDLDELTMEVTCEFAAPVEKVWQMWADPRKLERWWGPPMFPATFVRHELRPGGVMSYYMTSPEGEKHHGWWRIEAVDAPHTIELQDGFGEDPDAPAPGMPSTRMKVSVDAASATTTRVVISSQFPSLEALEQMLSMGMEEGLKLALGQIDEILGEAA